MIEPIYKMYKEQQRMVAHPEWASDEAEVQLIADMKLAITILDEKQPEYKNRYMREQLMQQSFTRDQINFICGQIGDWYLMMKPLLEGQHNLGRMKEELKVMICGD